jgi:hypothetical protein
VLPRSPFAPAEAAPPRRWWRGPLAAGGACALLLLLSFVLIVPRFVPRRNGTSEGAGSPDLKETIETGRRQMAQGKFHLARRTLSDAVARRDLDPSALGAAGHRELNQLHRQADLLARLLTVELSEVVRLARHARDPEDWALQFAQDFRGKGVLLDAPVGRDDRGRPVLLIDVVEAEDEPARVAIEELDVLRELPLDDGPRMVFGGRLAACEREPGGGWVVRLERDSGVLMTDLDAVTACDTAAPDDGLERALARQKRWLDGRADVAPARP